MLLKKDFEGDLRAILIQDEHRRRKIDTRSQCRRFDCCERVARSRLFQQHRSKPVSLKASKCFPVCRRKRTLLTTICSSESCQKLPFVNSKSSHSLRETRGIGARSMTGVCAIEHDIIEQVISIEDVFGGPSQSVHAQNFSRIQAACPAGESWSPRRWSAAPSGAIVAEGISWP